MFTGIYQARQEKIKPMKIILCSDRYRDYNDWADRQTDRYIGRQIDRQTDRQTDTEETD